RRPEIVDWSRGTANDQSFCLEACDRVGSVIERDEHSDGLAALGHLETLALLHTVEVLGEVLAELTDGRSGRHVQQNVAHSSGWPQRRLRGPACERGNDDGQLCPERHAG